MNLDNPTAKETIQSDQSSPKEEEELIEKNRYEQKLKDYSMSLEKMRDQSSSLFEKQLIYICGGSLAGSVIVVDKFLSGVQKGFIWVLVSWLLWGSAMVINLFSHSKARNLYNHTLGEIIMEKYDKEKADKRAIIVERYNKSSLYSYLIGVICFLIFFLTNLTQLNKPKASENNKIQIIENQIIEKKLDR